MLNRYIDHTILKAFATSSDIEKLCQEAKDNGFASVCIPPVYVEFAKQLLDKSEVKICTVIGFPLGYDQLSTKIKALEIAMDHGAEELDVVINLTAVKNKNWLLVESEIDTISTIVDKRSDKILKLILETAYLSFEELEILCNLCIKYNVDFAKTSTGFAPEGAKLEVVSYMKSILKDKVRIKASGGIKTIEFAKALIDAGADRLGTSSGLDLIK